MANAPVNTPRRLMRIARVAVLGIFIQSVFFCEGVLAGTVTVIANRQSTGYDEIIDAVREEVSKTPGTTIEVVYLSSSDKQRFMRLPDETNFVVTVGVQSAQQVAAMTDLKMPVLSVLIPRASYESAFGGQRLGRKNTAIYLDQPAHRQIDLLRAVIPGARTVGMVLGPATQRDGPVYRGLATSRGLSVQMEVAERETELYPVLQSVLRASDVLLALPEPTIVNVSTAQNILLSSFRFRVPVIGYSASYVRAGALAAVFSTPRQIGLEAGQLIRQYQRTGNLPPPRYARNFSVAVNRQIAETLGLAVADEAALVQRLQQLEGFE